MSDGKRKPGFFSRLFTGVKNVFSRIFPVAKSVLSVVNPGLGKLAGVAGQILGNSRGARLAKGLSRASDVGTKISGVIDHIQPVAATRG